MFNLFRKISNVNLIIPCYHTVSDEKLEHLSGLYRPLSQKEFVKEIDFLGKNYYPLTIQNIIQFLNDEYHIKRPSMLLTFDDGLREFHDIIAPILYQKGIPAVCFINTAFIDNKDIFFRYKAALLSKFNNTVKIERYSSFINNHNKKKKLNSLNDLLFSIKFSERHILDIIANDLNYSFSDYLAQKKPYLSSSQIISLKEKGFDFGSHSHEHPEFQYLTLEEQIYQVEKSFQILKELGITTRIFSFPFTDYGVKMDFFAWAFDPEEPKLDLTFGGAKMKKDICPLNLHRLPMEYKKSTIKVYLISEYFKHIAKKIIGKDFVMRTWEE